MLILMSTPNSETDLRAGIAALKAGNRAQARDLLLRVVDKDDSNEMAWLWLSGAVDSLEDRQICLENVLTINPNNAAARRGLAKLTGQEQEAQTRPTPNTPITVRREIPANTLAAAILYPERQIQEWQEHKSTSDYTVQTTGLKHTSSYHDVWERDTELCAYCAQEITPQTNTCPQCGRNLLISAYRYENPSANLHVLWVLLVAIAQLYLIQAIYDVIARQNLLAAALPICLMALFLIFTAGVYFRQFWGYVGAIAALSIILFINIIGLLLPAELKPEALLPIAPMIDEVVNPIVRGLDDFLRYFQLATIVLALIVATLKAGPDFERVQRRQIAQVQKGVQEAARYHAIAREAAKRGEWATAVLHWQRAAAKAPGQVSFQRHLGSAYARLGFYQRSADILQAALPQTNDPAQKAQIEHLLQVVNQHTSNTQEEKHNG